MRRKKITRQNTAPVHTERKKQVWIWVMIILSAIFIVMPFVFYRNHWPGGAILSLMLPVPIALLIAGVVKLSSRNYGVSSRTDSSLKVDYRVRYAFNRRMKSKRKHAWMLLVLYAIEFVVVIGCCMMLIGGSNVSICAIALAIIALCLSVLECVSTIRTSRQVEVAMRKNSQTDFEEAMRKWSWISWLTVVDVVLIIVLCVISFFYILQHI